ncbi:MAG: hypothetical protein CBC16_09655 [Verrucomicrobia bacterium TMED56]|nr:MAG: hypothetical protein CBC16_09655 [Verrucomicrobia bacterium TMED56]|tara:strand:- start:239 stop:574 length:336 start_codon:yes stop_codon:yes gene_type:complete
MSNDKKQTFKWVAPEDGSTETATFTSTDQARGIVFTDAATAYHNDANNFRQIQWALVDNKTLKCTILYGNDSGVAKDFPPGIATLESADNYYDEANIYHCTELTDDSDHLF